MWLRPALLPALVMGSAFLFAAWTAADAQQAGKVWRIGVLGNPTP